MYAELDRYESDRMGGKKAEGKWGSESNGEGKEKIDSEHWQEEEGEDDESEWNVNDETKAYHKDELEEEEDFRSSEEGWDN